MAISFLEIDSNKIYNAIITALEESVGEPLYPGDERRIFGEAEVALVVSIYNAVNDACKQKMLQYARGEVLDGLGELLNCVRISPAAAVTTLRFGVKSAITNNIVIPAGTKVTPDNSIYFATTEAVVLEAGQLSVDVEAACTETGASHNGYEAGMINQLTDLVPYIDTVSNIDVSHDGDDGEPYDTTGDDKYRARIKLAPTALSVAGPEDAYKYHALSADSRIKDVAIISDEETVTRVLPVYAGHCFMGGPNLHTASIVVYPHSGSTPAAEDVDYTYTYVDNLLDIEIMSSGVLAAATSIDVSVIRDMATTVLIVPILENGEIPDEDMINKIYEACRAKDVRPMTDRVIVQAPEQIPYDINIRYYTTAAEESACIESIEGSGGAVAQFMAWQDTVMGRNINPDKLRSLCLSPKDAAGNELTGCTRMEIIAPVFTELNKIQVPKFSGTLSISHIVEDD